MIKKVLSTLGAAVILGSGLAATAPASADKGDQRRCVTQNEFKRINKGMTKARVHKIFDTRGVLVSSSSGTSGRRQYREYRTCAGDPEYSYASVGYDNSTYRRPGLRVWYTHMYIYY